jgi:hypothetical protein
MEFECNLYHMQESYGRLEDGKLVMQVKVKK